jgi:hypothetical protein
MPSQLSLLIMIASCVFANVFRTDEKKGPQPAWGTSVEGFRLALSTPREVYPAGEPVELKLLLQNIDTKARAVDRSATLNSHEFQVTGPDGKVISMSERGKAALKNARQSSWSTIRLEPKAELAAYVLDIGEVYDLVQPGEYKIVASRRVGTRADENKSVMVTSNTLMITISKSKDTKKE